MEDVRTVVLLTLREFEDGGTWQNIHVGDQGVIDEIGLQSWTVTRWSAKDCCSRDL